MKKLIFILLTLITMSGCAIIDDLSDSYNESYRQAYGNSYDNQLETPRNNDKIYLPPPPPPVTDLSETWTNPVNGTTNSASGKVVTDFHLIREELPKYEEYTPQPKKETYKPRQTYVQPEYKSGCTVDSKGNKHCRVISE